MDQREIEKAADKIVRDHFGANDDVPAGLEDAIYDAIYGAATDAVSTALDEVDAAVTAVRSDY